MFAPLIPAFLSWGLKLIRDRADAAEKKVTANPKASTGGGATVIVTSLVAIGCVVAEMYGITVSPEMKQAVIAFSLAVGGIYTAWRGNR